MFDRKFRFFVATHLVPYNWNSTRVLYRLLETLSRSVSSSVAGNLVSSSLLLETLSRCTSVSIARNFETRRESFIRRWETFHPDRNFAHLRFEKRSTCYGPVASPIVFYSTPWSNEHTRRGEVDDTRVFQAHGSRHRCFRFRRSEPDRRLRSFHRDSRDSALERFGRGVRASRAYVGPRFVSKKSRVLCLHDEGGPTDRGTDQRDKSNNARRQNVFINVSALRWMEHDVTGGREGNRIVTRRFQRRWVVTRRD